MTVSQTEEQILLIPEEVPDFKTGPLSLNLLKKVCARVERIAAFTEADVLVLQSLYGGKMIKKALEIVENGWVQYVTIEGTERTYFYVQGANGRFYTLYPDVNFCQCPMYKYEVLAKRRKGTCKHVIASALALALGRAVTTTTSDLHYDFHGDSE